MCGETLTPLEPKIQNGRHKPYSCSQLPPALSVFRLFFSHFLLNSNVILQALFASTPALVPTIS